MGKSRTLVLRRRHGHALILQTFLAFQGSLPLTDDAGLACGHRKTRIGRADDDGAEGQGAVGV